MKRLSTLVACFVLLCVSCSGPTPPPPGPAPAAVVLLGRNGLSDAERQEFYHLAEGSELFPYDWLRYLEQVENGTPTGKPFLDNLERFGLVADPKGPGNEEGLPVGVTVAERKGTGVRMIGVNCAACHVGTITYQGRTLRVDGAPNLFDVVGFYTACADALTASVTKPDLLFRFLKRLTSEAGTKPVPAHGVGIKGVMAELDTATHAVLGKFEGLEDLRAAGELERGLAGEFERIAGDEVRTFAKDEEAYVEGLANREPVTASRVEAVAGKTAGAIGGEIGKDDPGAFVRAVLEDVREHVGITLSYAQMLHALQESTGKGTTAGFGRADAFDTARFLLVGIDNFVPLTAPSSFPFIWGFERSAWLHYASNTNSVLERNIGQALGLGASADMKTLETTIRFDDLYRLETLGYKITPPEWPEDLFGPIDRAKADRGRPIYTQHCAGCHDGAPTEEGTGLLAWKLVPAAVIGTDENELKNWNSTVQLDGKVLSMAEAHVLLLGKIRQAYFTANNVSPADQDRMENGRKNTTWRGSRGFDPTRDGYPAKPLAGIWATAPYLHNGSVPTLHDLLLPPDRRPVMFPVGQREYDPVRLGYKQTDAPAWAFVFRVSGSGDGNANTGHAYAGDMTEDERMALLEYLKVHK